MSVSMLDPSVAMALAEAATDAVIFTDMRFAVQGWNRAAERMYGWSADEVVGLTLAEFLPTRYPVERPEDVRAHFQTRGSWQGAALQTTRDGRLLRVQASVVLVKDPSGAPLGVLAVNRDVTDDAARAQALESERSRLLEVASAAQHLEALGRLAGGVAHEFNNLMAIIRGSVELVQATLPARSPAQADLAEIGRAEQRASRLTDQLLAFSRSEPGQTESLDLNETMAALAEMLRRLLPRAIELQLRPQEGPCRLQVDRARLEQAVVNLTLNAGDAMPKGGRLTLSTDRVLLSEAEAAATPGARPGPYVVLSVQDEGVGMSAETVARMFEPFFTTKPTGEGAGLGLAVVFGFLQESSGFHRVETRLGQGTTVRIYLPEAEEEPEAAEDRPTRVLIAEDEPALRGLCRRILEFGGMEAEVAEDGREALERFERDPTRYDVVLTDIVMPRMGGIELAQALRQDFGFRAVVFMSGYSRDHRGVGLANSDAPFVRKPFRAAQLIEAVQAAALLAAAPVPGR